MTQGARICWAVEAGPISYGPACDLQRRLVQARKAGAIPDVLLVFNHPLWNLYGNPAPANTATVRVLFDAANMISGETLKIDDVGLTSVP